MGFFDKMKNLFMEEEEEPIKSEVTQVEIPAPVKIEKEEVVTDNVTIKAEDKVNAPIFFDDNYFKELEQPKKEVKSSYLKEPVKKVKEDKKQFKPTPIISPVYGVLDKNYNKEDITTKQEKMTYRNNSRVTIDEIRKKAYGTLEDELENTLFGNNSILFNDEVEKAEEDLFDDLTNFEEEIEEIKEIDIIDDEPLLENDLFDLIDSMYAKGE